MRFILPLAAIALAAVSFTGCKSDGAAAATAVCDTVCLTDSLKFIRSEHLLKPHVYLSAKDCRPDTLSWNYDGYGATSFDFINFIGADVKLNPAAVGCYIRDTSYALLYFNDCSNGQGYLVRLPFNKRDKISRVNSAINSFDKKFHIDESMIAYSDRGNLFAEDKATGKQATLTFGKRLEIDYAAIHDYIDSVNVTPTRMWAKVKIDGEWKELEKKIELK